MKFYQCSHCKNIVAYVQDNGPKVSWWASAAARFINIRMQSGLFRICSMVGS